MPPLAMMENRYWTDVIVPCLGIPFPGCDLQARLCVEEWSVGGNPETRLALICPKYHYVELGTSHWTPMEAAHLLGAANANIAHTIASAVVQPGAGIEALRFPTPHEIAELRHRIEMLELHAQESEEG